MKNSLIVLIVLLACSSCSPPNRQHPHRRNQAGEVSCRENHSAFSSTLLRYTGFTVSYNPATRQPDWVSYTLTAEQVALTRHTPKIPRRFMPDPNLTLPQATNEDYSGSGWVRGHMARRQDMKWSEQAVKESDYFTNICPQNKEMNNGIWHQIENMARQLAVKYDSVMIVCGPIYTSEQPQSFGIHNIPVPDGFFKAFLVSDNSGFHTVAFLCPNTAEIVSLTMTICCVDDVELASGIDLFNFLDDGIEEAVESRVDLVLYPFSHSRRPVLVTNIT